MRMQRKDTEWRMGTQIDEHAYYYADLDEKTLSRTDLQTSLTLFVVLALQVVGQQLVSLCAAGCTKVVGLMKYAE